MGWFGDLLKGVVGSIPIVGGVAKAAINIGEHLLSHKQPMSKPMSVFPAAPDTWTASGMQKSSPVMPGGGVATPWGVAPQMGAPPAHYGGRGRKTKRRRAHSTRTRTRHRASSRKRSGGRKLKFGSAAYRKKYLRHRR